MRVSLKINLRKSVERKVQRYLYVMELFYHTFFGSQAPNSTLVAFGPTAVEMGSYRVFWYVNYKLSQRSDQIAHRDLGSHL